MKIQEVSNDAGTYIFWCPGCNMLHQVPTKGEGRPNWQFNGSLDKPTFMPSIRVQWPYGNPPVENMCHSFVRDGKIQFLSDCTHARKSTTVDLPEIEDKL